jgi:hypothetical protein
VTEAVERTVAVIPDEDLVRRAVLSAVRNRRPKRTPPWVAVMDAFGLGSTFATQLCRRFEVDPDKG